MFWVKFPNHSLSKLRVCTLNSRFKDCSTISEIKHLSQVSCRKIGDILKYAFSASVRDEIESIGRAGEEFNAEDSYFPYMRELRLSKRSPYSSTENVHLHNWICTFGALLGSERSFNARIVSESVLMMSLNLSMFAAYAFRKYSTPQMVFSSGEDAKMAEDFKQLEAETSEAEFHIDPSSALGVFKHMQECGNSIPVEMKQLFAPLINKMGIPREKTIGQFIKRNL